MRTSLSCEEVSFKQISALQIAIDDYAKDGGEELFTKMHCVLLSNSYRIVKDS